MMETMDIKVFDALRDQGINGLTKSAVIYRDESARFIYVCFHCGSMFNECKEALQHIESHFQFANVMVNQTSAIDSQLTKDGHDITDKLAMSPTHDNVAIKTEAPDEYGHDFPLTMMAVPIIQTMFCEEDEVKPESKKRKITKERTSKKAKQSTGVKASRNEGVIENPYRCHICSKVWKNASTLRGHLNCHTNAELLRINRCKECDEYFKSASTLRSHVLKIHLTRQSTDGSQNCDFVRYEEKESFAEERHACEFCTDKFYIKANLNVHVNSAHSGGRRLQCSTCNAIFTAPKNYYAHQSEHKRVGSNTNEFDEKSALASIDALIDERIAHEEGQLFHCRMCDFTAEMHHDIRSHIRRKHVYPMFPPPVELRKEYICDYCGVPLKSKHALLKHFLIHTNTKTHPCRFCGKLFRIASTTKIHERQHTGEKPYQCHECGKAFISKGLLTAHKKTHEDTTYPCHICGKVFRLPHHYSKHVKTHRVERDFKCTVCSKTFNTRIYLMRHMEIHSERKHKCHYCDSTFNTGDGRRQHQRHKHKYEMSLPM